MERIYEIFDEIYLASVELTYPCPDIDTLTNIQYKRTNKQSNREPGGTSAVKETVSTNGEIGNDVMHTVWT